MGGFYTFWAYDQNLFAVVKRGFGDVEDELVREKLKEEKAS